MAQWEANILHEITVIGNDQNIDGTTTISEVNLVICDCNATETGMIIVTFFSFNLLFSKCDKNIKNSLETAYCEGFHEAIVGPTTAAMPWWAILIIVLVVLIVLGKFMVLKTSFLPRLTNCRFSCWSFCHTRATDS